MDWSQQVVAVARLEYVGQPPAGAVRERIKTVSFDRSETKVKALLHGEVPTGKVGCPGLQQAKQFSMKYEPTSLTTAHFIGQVGDKIAPPEGVVNLCRQVVTAGVPLTSSIAVAVASHQFSLLSTAEMLSPGGLVVDVKALLDGSASQAPSYHFWRH